MQHVMLSDTFSTLYNKTFITVKFFNIFNKTSTILYSNQIPNLFTNYFDFKDSDILDENEFRRQTIVGMAREASKDLRKSVLNSLLDHISSKFKGMEKFLSPGATLNTEEVYSLHEYVEYMKEVARLTTFLSEDDRMKNNIDNAVKRLSYIRKEVCSL